jgi:hypothetical protein
MGMTTRQQEEFDGLMAELKSQEPEALATHLALQMVFSFYSRQGKAEIVAEVKQRSSVIRRNRRIVTRGNKFARLKELHGKKRRNPDEKKELEALCRYFEREIRAAGGDS